MSWRTRRRRRDLFFVFTKLFTQIGFALFEVGNQRLAAIFNVKDLREIFDLLVEIGHVPQFLAAAVHIAGAFFLVAHMPGDI